MDIELVHIRKSFGAVHANDDISLRIPAGSIFGMVGENGAGKSTLLKILCGFWPADAGLVRLNGVPAVLHSVAEGLRAGIGMLHQDPMDFPPLSALENFMAGQGGLRCRRRQARERLLALARPLGFYLNPDAPVEGMTVGERQQLEIVRLLDQGVRALILDEPTTGLSAGQKQRLFEAIRTLSAQGLTVIMVTHKLQEVVQLCHQAAILRQGKLQGILVAPFPEDEMVRLMFGQDWPRVPRVAVAPERTVLEITDLAFENRGVFLEGFSLSVRAGEMIGLAGMNGSGQELLLRVCAGWAPPMRGQIRVQGEALAHQGYPRFLTAGVVFVPAARLEEGLVRGLTLLEHVWLARFDARGFLDWPWGQERLAAGLEAYQMEADAGQKVESLSGGNQQRFMLSLLPEQGVQVLLLEQPTRGLDEESTSAIWSKMALRCRQQSACLLFTSSDLDELLTHSDRILVFCGGRIIGPLDAASLGVDELGHLIGERAVTPVARQATAS